MNTALPEDLERLRESSKRMSTAIWLPMCRRSVRQWLGLPVGVPLGGGEVFAQLICRAARTVPRGVALNPPTLLQRTRIDDIEPERVEQTRHCRLGVGVVAGDD